MLPRFPLYIVSKGRWDTRMTARTLDEIGVPFRIIVEAAEQPHYAQAVGAGRVLVLDPAYQRAYDTCDAAQPSRSPGSGPARNFAWEHAIAEGAAWHWVMDDNIVRFYRWHENAKVPVADGAIFRAMEDFCLRYSNVAMAGPNYESFAHRRTVRPPFVLNTRIFSCNLIRNDVPFRWRGRWNEDADLSLRLLKARWCTVLFNAFLQNKVATQRVRGGNTEAYQRDGTWPKSRMLQALHPDVTDVVMRWGRVHHYVDYRPFRTTPLLRCADAPPTQGDYGMRLTTIQEIALARP